MIRICKTKAAVCLLFFGLACLAGGFSGAAEEEPDEGTIQLIIEFVGDADRETRAVGLQYIREQVPGEAATKRFTALLPDLSPDGQADLLDALGDRGDAAARPAVLEMLDNQQEAVRTAALRAIGALGGAADVPLLAGKAATDSKLENAAARQSLTRLRGDDVNAAILSAMAKGEPNVRAELLGVLAARNAKETLPTVIENVEDPDASVRLAALGALRFLADESHTAVLVKILKAAQDDAHRRKAELALLVVCSRGRQACADPIIDGLADADVPSGVALLRALARAGGAKALEAVAARLQDRDKAVADEAVRMLSIWPDPAAMPQLLAIAKAGDNLRHQVLAIRGLVRLASPQEDKPADMKTLADVMGLAQRPQEKRLLLGALGGIAAAESLALVTPLLDDPGLKEEAALAAVMIAENISDGDQDTIRAAMEKVAKGAKGKQTRDRAQKVLKSL